MTRSVTPPKDADCAATAAVTGLTTSPLLTSSTLPPAAEALRPLEACDGGDLKVLTWNVCAIAHPFVAPRLVLLGLLFFRDWTHKVDDVPLDAQSGRARRRWAAQAAYIRSAAADVVLLQEVSSRATLDSLMGHLADEYEAAYIACAPTGTAVALWGLAMLAVSSAQLALLLPLATCLPVEGFGVSACAQLALLCIVNALRWRHSCVTQYLLGSIAGQLVVLRRTSSTRVCADGFAATWFETFVQGDAQKVQCSSCAPRPSANSEAGAATSTGTAPSPHSCCGALLKLFFGLRPRGVLRVDATLITSKSAPSGGATRGSITFMNTHLPHLSENSAVLERCAELTQGVSYRAAVVFGGDLNPLPDLPITQQLQPLLDARNEVADTADGWAARWAAGEASRATWDLAQPLTRCAEETPRDMQLDFVLSQPQRALGSDADCQGGKQSCRATVSFGRATSCLHDPDAFRAATISDHSGLLSTLPVRFALL